MRNPFSKTYEPNELKMFDFLQGIKFFELLKQQELARFLPAMHERKYARDEVVFFSKDPSQALYLIRWYARMRPNCWSFPNLRYWKSLTAIQR